MKDQKIYSGFEYIKYFFYLSVPVLLATLTVQLFQINNRLDNTIVSKQDSQRANQPIEIPIAPEQIPDTIRFGNHIIQTGLIRDKVHERIVHYVTHTERLLEIKKFEHRYSYIRHILREEGLHPKFWFLAMNESLLDPDARSSAGAVGMFQFGVGTAVENGLYVGIYIDDRREPVRSARAFVRLIKNLIKYYDYDFAMALAAYNRGRYGMNRTIRESEISDYYRLDGNSLPRETKYYVAGIAALSLLHQTEYYRNLPLVNPAEPEAWIEVRISPKRAIHLSEINELLGDDSFMDMNHQFIRYLIPRMRQVIVVPGRHYAKLEKFFRENSREVSLPIDLK